MGLYSFKYAMVFGDTRKNVSEVIDAAWLTRSTNSSTRGLESSTINLTASENNSGDERVAIVKLTDTSSGTTSEFTIKQELTPSFSIDAESIEVDEFGSEVEVSVTITCRYIFKNCKCHFY